MVSDLPPASLQESILASLIFDEKSGPTIAAQVSPNHFDDTYREIAEKVLAYRRKYSRGPGHAHLDDLFDKRLQDNNRPSRVRRLLLGLAGIAEELNGDYVVARTQQFVREQQLKAALVEANARWEQGGEQLAPDIEAVLHRALKFRAQTLDAGTFLNDAERGLRFLDRPTETGVSFGIRELDRLGIFLYPKEMTLYIGSKGSGKTMCAVHIGKRALLSRKRVVHISCEVSEELVTQRYYQSLFAAATSPDKFDRTTFEFSKLKKFMGFRTRKVAPKWNFSQSGARKELRKRIHSWGTRFGRLVIKEFPSGTLTVQHLEAYLDFLEQEHHFQPNVLILDYPDLMAQDAKNYRISVGRTFVGIRGILVDRHMAGFCPTQGNRSSIRAEKVRSDMVAEDISKINTADIVLTYSRTEAEKERGLARLHVANARNNRDGGTIILTQSYDTGQFVLESHAMEQVYWERLEEVAGEAAVSEAQQEEDYDE